MNHQLAFNAYGKRIRFDAFSQRTYTTVSADEVQDFSELFYCPDHECAARFQAVASRGGVPAHFLQLADTSHIRGCPYRHCDPRYFDRPGLRKLPIEEIYASSTRNSEKTDT